MFKKNFGRITPACISHRFHRFEQWNLLLKPSRGCRVIRYTPRLAFATLQMPPQKAAPVGCRCCPLRIPAHNQCNHHMHQPQQQIFEKRVRMKIKMSGSLRIIIAQAKACTPLGDSDTIIPCTSIQTLIQIPVCNQCQFVLVSFGYTPPLFSVY